jgi:ABC-type sugar transport system substrate-binding protein
MAQQTQMDTAIETNVATLITQHSDPAALIRKIMNEAVDAEIVQLNHDLNKALLKITDLEDVTVKQGADLLQALQRITNLENR